MDSSVLEFRLRVKRQLPNMVKKLISVETLITGFNQLVPCDKSSMRA